MHQVLKYIWISSSYPPQLTIPMTDDLLIGTGLMSNFSFLAISTFIILTEVPRSAIVAKSLLELLSKLDEKSINWNDIIVNFTNWVNNNRLRTATEIVVKTETATKPEIDFFKFLNWISVGVFIPFWRIGSLSRIGPSS